MLRHHKAHCTSCAGQQSEIDTIELCGIAVLLGVFFGTSEHQILTRPRLHVVTTSEKADDNVKQAKKVWFFWILFI